jgi:2-amino-4-hydroxy-6-hydroxymethyldihydropteridine diphosphokinase
MSHTVFISLGSNVGNRAAYLESAREGLRRKISLEEVSPIYETKPWGFTSQPNFLNQVVRCTTNLEPHDLLVFLKSLEAQLGRIPTFRYGPRQIDLDILLFDDLVLDSPDLTLPHPHLHERAFVLVPLADLAPASVHPILNSSIQDLLARLDISSVKSYPPSAPEPPTYKEGIKPPDRK